MSLFISIVEHIKLMESVTFNLRLQGELGKRRNVRTLYTVAVHND